MKAGERLRLRFVFGSLGVVPVFLGGWLGWVQVAQAGQIVRDGKPPLPLVADTADRQALGSEVVPRPRGTIVDRNGAALAVDCEGYDVRARIVVPNKEGKTCEGLRAWIGELAGDFARAMAADPDLADRGEALREHRAQFDELLEKNFKLDRLPATGPVPEGQPRVVDVRIAGGVDVLAVVDALREIGERRGSVTMHFLRSWHRAYPERKFTYGLVGHVDSRWQVAENGVPQITTFGVCGLESLAALQPDVAASRDFLRDGKGQTYFKAPLESASRPNVLHSTIDIDLQRCAVRELATQAEAGAREGTVTIPAWGALVLVEVATGDVLAAASWHRDAKKPEASAFTPYQSLYEPGSIVKPLVFAYALEAGALDWSHEFDCAAGSAEYRERIGAVAGSRVVRDDHACSVLTPHGILMNSSNIGATYVGLQLEREQWQDYMRFFGFGESLRLHMPHERRGGTDSRSFDPSIPLRSFKRNSAISFSFGYEMQVTAMHIARAYLRLFRGASADLRLCRGVEVGGQWLEAPSYRQTASRFRPEVVDAVRAAMVDVVSADPHATGTYLHARMLKEEGIDLHGVVAGKTGTAASKIGIPGRGKVESRNASFVGFLPVEQPRWLAVCVLQKDDSARFYGGSYAAPPAVRLLLQCQNLEQRRVLQREPQSAFDGSGGQTRTAIGSPGIQAEASGFGDKRR